MTAFFNALVVLTLVTMLTRNRALVVTSVLLFANWAINSFICFAETSALDPFPYPVISYMLVDYATGLSIVSVVPMWMQLRPNRWQISVTAIYTMQVVWHGGYVASAQDAWAKYYSWHFLSWTAWAQLLVVGVWCGVVISPIIRDAFRRMASGKFVR